MNFCDIKPHIRHCEKIDIENFNCSDALASYNHLMIYVIEGTAELSVKDRKYKLSRGWLLILKPGSFYSLTIEKDFEAVMIYYDYECNNENKTYIKPQTREKFSTSQKSETYFDGKESYFNSDIITDGFVHTQSKIVGIFEIYNNNSEYREMLMQSYLTLILIEIMENIKIIKNPIVSQGGINKVIMEYIHKNFNRNITLDEMSEELNFHKSYINVVVRKETGFSVHKYITMRRISKAVELLQFSDFSISEIANIVGIPDISHFSKSFKILMGKSPRQFRKSDKQKELD